MDLANAHAKAKAKEIDEIELLEVFAASIVLVPSQANPKMGKLLPATSTLGDVSYVLAFDSYESAKKTLGKQLRKAFLPSVYGDKFIPLIEKSYGLAVGTRTGGLFTVSPEVLRSYSKKIG